MYPTEIIILIVCYMLDMGLTYCNTKMFKYIRPDTDAEQYELNELVRFMWKKFGLGWGTIMANLVIFPLLLGLLYLIRNHLNYLYFMFGVYFIILYLHIVSFINLFFYKVPIVPPKEDKTNESNNQTEGKV